ncbi:MAG: EAL domain-containing protein [Pseudomonadota bacterium]
MNVHDLPLSHVMQTGLLHCAPATPLREAAQRMTERQCSCILVIENRQALGIWTEHDALGIDFFNQQTRQEPIERHMSSPVATAPMHMRVDEAARLLSSRGHRHLLVTDADDLPVGIVSQTDIALHQGLEPYLRLREVHTAMQPHPLVLDGELLLNDVSEKMRLNQHDAAIVNTSDGLGIVTERDFIGFVARHPGTTSIGQLASRPLHTIAENAPLIQARELLIYHGIRHLAVLDGCHQVSGLIGFRDILMTADHHYLDELRDALEQRDSALAKSRQNLELAERVIESSLEGIIITDAQTRIEFVNPAFTHMTGYTLEEVTGKTPSVLASGRQDERFYQQMWACLQENGYWRGEVWNRRKSGELYLELLTITAITDQDGITQHYAGLFTDITHMRENEEQIRHLAYYDPLTRLPNRRLLEDRLKLAMHHAHRAHEPLALIFIDLDHFKQVNDTLGHAVGDELLMHAADRMRGQLREDDTLARLGGDEFIILLSSIRDFGDATGVAQRIISTISAPYAIDGHEFRVGCSLGISVYPDDGDTPTALMHSADAAMYRAKQEGRNTYRLYRAEMDRQAQQHLSLETALRNTLEGHNGIEMHYQPIYNRNTGAIASAESLARWYHPDHGWVSPGTFIPLAERSGLILPLGEHIIDRVLSDINHWRKTGITPPPIAINLSAAQFWQADFIAKVEKKLKDANIDPALITFELTESMLFERREQGMDVLSQLSALGCRIALDDFGTGYSSLSYLHKMAANSLKIDQSFIAALDDNTHDSRPIVAAISSLAEQLGLSVVAEGVETEQQLALLGQYPIDAIQGFYLSRPLKPADFQALIAT